MDPFNRDDRFSRDDRRPWFQSERLVRPMMRWGRYELLVEGNVLHDQLFPRLLLHCRCGKRARLLSSSPDHLGNRRSGYESLNAAVLR